MSAAEKSANVPLTDADKIEIWLLLTQLERDDRWVAACQALAFRLKRENKI